MLRNDLVMEIWTQKSLNPVGTPGLWSRRWSRRLRDKQREWDVSAEILHTVKNLVPFAVLVAPLEPATAPPIPGLTARCFVRFVERRSRGLEKDVA